MAVTAEAALVVLVAAATATATAVAPVALLDEATAGFSGPGPGGWVSSSPAYHGLSSARLATASKQVAEVIPVRDCFLIAKE